MTYTFKLARRLARMRHLIVLTLLVFVAACSAGEPTGTSDIGLTELSDLPIALAPRQVTLETSQAALFRAYEGAATPGANVATSVEWTATGGSIGSDGVYSSGAAGTFQVVALKRGKNRKLSDTAVVRIVPPQPTLASIIVTPGNAQLVVGGQQTFTATGVLADGSHVPIGVVWSASGGTIDAGGTYTGTTPGSHRIIAKSASRNIADTIAVTVVADAPQAPSPNYPNLPSGFTTLVDESWSYAPQHGDGWTGQGMASGQKATIAWSTANAKLLTENGRTFLREIFPAGLGAGGGAPYSADLWSERWPSNPKKELYVSFVFRVYGKSDGSGTFQNEATNQKLFYISYANTNQQNQSFPILDGWAGLPIPGTQVRLATRIRQMNADGSDPGGAAALFPPNVNPGAATISVGPNSWHQVEIYYKANTISPSYLADGTYKMWVDGKLVAWYGPGGPGAGIRFISPQNPMGFYNIRWDPIFGGTSSTKTQTDYLDYDALYVAGR